MEPSLSPEQPGTGFEDGLLLGTDEVDGILEGVLEGYGESEGKSDGLKDGKFDGMLLGAGDAVGF